MLHHFDALHVTLTCMTSYATTLLKYVMTIFQNHHSSGYTSNYKGEKVKIQFFCLKLSLVN